MDENLKKLLVIGAICTLLIFAMFSLCTKSGEIKKRTVSPKKSTQIDQLSEANSLKSKTINKPHPTQTTSSSKSFATYSQSQEIKSVVTFSAKTLANNLAFKEQALATQRKRIQQDIQNLLDDPKTPPAQRLKARLITSPNYVAAFTAYKNDDYPTAIKAYHKVFSDKASTPEMKYIALEGLQKCAKLTGDLDLFLLTSQELGRLIMESDLSLLSVKKSRDYYDWAIDLTNYMQARTNNSTKEKLIATNIKENSLSRKRATEIVELKIKEYEIIFKELIN